MKEKQIRQEGWFCKVCRNQYPPDEHRMCWRAYGPASTALARSAKR